MRSPVLLLLHLFLPSSHALVPSFPAVTKTPSPLYRRDNSVVERQAISTELSTCGYLNGDPDKERTADAGFNCRIDTRNGIWGFCPTTVISATDCGLAGGCIDKYECTKGCGMMSNKDLTTFTCATNSFCSMALLTFGVDQTYSYVACGGKAATDHYYITPTVQAETTTETSESTSSTEISESSSSFSNLSSEETSDTPETEKSTTLTSQVSSALPTSNPSSETSSSLPAAESSSPEESTSKEPTSMLGPIIGGVIGGLVVICSTAIAVIYLLRRNRNKSTGSEPSEKYPPSESWSSFETKQPQQLGGWGPQELPGRASYYNVQNGRQHPVELAS